MLMYADVCRDLLELMLRRVEKRDEEAIYFLTLLFDADEFIERFITDVTLAGWLVQKYKCWRSCRYKGSNTDTTCSFRCLEKKHGDHFQCAHQSLDAAGPCG